MTTPLAAEAPSPRGDDARPEVWLRGNARPALVLLAAVVIVAGLAVAVVVITDPPWWVAGAVAGGVVAALAAATGLVWAAAQPRIVRRGGELEIRLSPLGARRVPLGIVECVFPGSQPWAPAADADDAGGRRVNTLVLRLAERAAAWRSRPVAAAWGTWTDGNVVFDGRWCEPLSPDVARGIATRLLESKRGIAVEDDA